MTEETRAVDPGVTVVVAGGEVVVAGGVVVVAGGVVVPTVSLKISTLFELNCPVKKRAFELAAPVVSQEPIVAVDQTLVCML